MHPSHNMRRKTLHWVRCWHCGLVRLRNSATEKALNRKCPGSEEDKPKEK